MDRSLAAGLALFAILLAAPALLPLAGAGYLTGLLIKGMLLAIAGVSLNLLIGHGGMVSLGHAAFVGVGAYAAAIGLESGIEEILILLAITLAVTGGLAFITGVLALRTTGVYFLMITLAFSQMIYFTLMSLAAYGGDDGLTLWSLATFLGSDIVQNGSGLYFVTLGALFLSWWSVHRISQSRFGRVLRAARDNRERTAITGFDVKRIQLTAYVIAAMIAGVSGILVVQHAEFVSPALAGWQRSGDLIVVVVLGGLASRKGAVLGAFFVVLAEEILSAFIHEWRLIYGPLLVLLVLFARGGLNDLFTSRARLREA